MASESLINSQNFELFQMLEFRVFNVSNGTQPLKGRLPLSPGSSLTWFGFSEEGQLASYDSKVCLPSLNFTVSFLHFSRLVPRISLYINCVGHAEGVLRSVWWELASAIQVRYSSVDLFFTPFQLLLECLMLVRIV